MENNPQKPIHKVTVNHILTHSYSVFLFGLALAILLDSFFPIRTIPKYLLAPAGVALMILGPLLILWAQRTSGKLRLKKETLTKEDFKKGPYAFTRGPTHLGLTLLVMGFGVVSNSLLIIAIGILSYFVSKRIFLKEEEELLAKNYGEEYLRYQQEVNSWF